MRHVLVLLAALVLSRAGALADGIGNEDQPVYEKCAACHSLDGISHMPKFPKLAGQNAAYIVKQLEDFLHGRRANDGGQMATIVTEITDAQRLEAARYFSELPPPAPAGETDGDAARGRELFEKPDIAAGVPPCAACHLPRSASTADKSTGQAVPFLGAQHRSYIAKQLQDFKAGNRANDPDGIMRSVAAQLSEADIEALASFLGLTGP